MTSGGSAGRASFTVGGTESSNVSRETEHLDRESKKVGAVFEGVVAQPDQIQACLFTLDEVVVGEPLEPIRLGPAVAALRPVGIDEILQVIAPQRVLLEREVHVGTQVVHPQLASPWRFGGGLSVEEEHVRLHTLRVKHAGWQPQQRVDVAQSQTSQLFFKSEAISANCARAA